MYSRFTNDPLDEEYPVSSALWVPMLMVKSRQKRLRREAVIRFKVTGDQVLSMNLFHRLSLPAR